MLSHKAHSASVMNPLPFSYTDTKTQTEFPLKKSFFLLPAAPLLFAAAAVLFLLSRAKESDTVRFRRIAQEYFTSSLSRDCLSLHYTLADPTPWLQPVSPACLPVYSRSSQKAAAAGLENLLRALEQIRPERLEKRDRYTLALLLSYLKNEEDGVRFAYYDEPLSPDSGLHIQLPVLLAEYTFRTVEDLQTYLQLLDSLPACLESLARYEREKAAAGLFMTHADAVLVVEQCDRIMDSGLLDSEEHFLQTTFRERLQELADAGGVEEERIPYYMSENDRLLTTLAAPAYEALGDEIFLLSDSGVNEGGLSCYPDGKAYYSFLLTASTGSARTPEEISVLLSDSLSQTMEELKALLSEGDSLTGSAQADRDAALPSGFPLQEPAQMLEDLQLRMADDFPSISVFGSRPPACQVKTVVPQLTGYTSPAFYLTSPIDDPSRQVIYINPSSVRGDLELYTTLAHEGYPGHLYQTVCSQLYENSVSSCPVRSILYYGGYTEGWAYYTENMAYDYAVSLMAEHGVSEAEQRKALIRRCERNLQICLYSILDLSIHYYGAGREDAARALSSFGITDPDTADAVFDHIRREPASYPKYYLGYLEILALKDRARQLWGKKYTDLRFHTFLLQAGPSDFASLEALLSSDEA